MEIFNIENIKLDSIILIVDEKQTNKLEILMNILCNNKNLDNCLVFSDSTDVYEEFIHYNNIYKSYNYDIIDKVSSIKDKFIKSYIIFDNYNYGNNQYINELCINSRHYNNNNNIILLTKYICYITPVLRSNIDYTFILKNNSDIENIYNYIGLFSSLKKFYDIINLCPENYQYLILDQTSYDLENQVFCYKVNNNRIFYIDR